MLVELLAADTGEIAAELAAVVLRNLALGNAANRAAIVAAGGLQPLLHLLSMGQDKLVHPMACEVPLLQTPTTTMVLWVCLASLGCAESLRQTSL